MAYRLRSGHMPLNGFKFLMKKTESPNCDLCGVFEDIYHLVMECSRSADLRLNIFTSLNLVQLDVGLLQSILAEPTSGAARLLYQGIYKLSIDN